MPELKSYDFELLVTPEHGGCVDALNWRGQALLHPSRPVAKGPTDRASFPLVPFSGRIFGSRFSFEGQDYTLPANFLPEPNAIHGFGWQSSWQMLAQTDTELIIGHQLRDGIWPAAYDARQSFRLFEDRFEIELMLTNCGNRAMPAGLGWHPYFIAEDAQIKSQVNAIWRPENTDQIAQPEPLDTVCDLTSFRKVQDLSLDHCFSAQQAQTEIIWPNRHLQLTMTGTGIFSHFVLYTPEDETYFCAEPISHVPNAVNLSGPEDQTGFHVLQPGESLTGSITLKPSVLR